MSKEKIVGFTCGAFDLLHPGHIAMLNDCKRYCDHLIVGLHTDPSIDRPTKNKPIQSVYERYVQLKGCKHVDEIIPYDTEEDLQNLLSIESIDIRFVGSEYKGTYITAQKICDTRKIAVVYNTRLHNYSSTNLRNRLKEKKLNAKTENFD